jgi:hypothetical protein
MIPKFDRFVYFYDGCRHFGRTPSKLSYRKIDELTFDVAKECFDFGLRIWREVVQAFNKVPGAELQEFDVDSLSDDPEDY